jgi:NADH-quinone oxidoreductase subunit L
MPITYATFVIGALALCAIPPFSGFYSKDIIIEAVKLSQLPGATYAYYCVLAGAFVTPLYTFRAIFMTFHGKENTDAKLRGHIHESPWVVLLPLIALAIPSLIAGEILIDDMIFNQPKLLGDTIFVLPEHNVLNGIHDFHGAIAMALDAARTLPFWFAVAGIVTAALFTLQFPKWSEIVKKRFAWLYQVLVHKYGFDDFNQAVFVHGTQESGHLFYDVGDVKVIDGVFVNGSGWLIRWFAKTGRQLQTGYIYHYALAMVLGILLFLAWYRWGL